MRGIFVTFEGVRGAGNLLKVLLLPNGSRITGAKPYS